jgi:hypothetical protein
MQLANEKKIPKHTKREKVFLVGRDPEYSGYL